MHKLTQHSFHAAGWVAVCALGLSACLSAPPTQGAECAQSSDCATNEVCEAGSCVATCNQSADCDPSQACEGGICKAVANPACTAHDSCSTAPPCYTATGAQCVAGQCEYPPQMKGVVCDDGDLCTHRDACDGAGECVGAAVACDSPPPAECNDTDDTYTFYSVPGTCDPTSGACHYTPSQVSCLNCQVACLEPCLALPCDDLQGGCRTSGACDPGPPVQCVYDYATDASPCDIGTGPGTGVCVAGECLECASVSDCGPPPNGPEVCFSVACVDHVCEYTPQPNEVCAAAECVDGAAYPERTCGVDGACSGGGGASCNGFKCASDGVSCLTTCSGDDDCMPGLICQVDNTCGLGLALGQSCSAGVECESGFCVDGVCCESACDGACTTCNSAGLCQGNSVDHHECGLCEKCSDGSCVPQGSSEDLKNECSADAGCGSGNCNGSGACDYAAAGTQGETCTVCRECNGSGSCVNVQSGQQRPGCNGGQTTCSNADACNGAGACLLNHLSAGAEGNGAGCPVCQDCDGSGSCTYVAAGVADVGCDGGQTTCSNADTCNGSGVCLPNHLAAGAEGNGAGCPVCQDCNGAGSCGYVPEGQSDVGCSGGATICSNPDTCDGNGACQPNHLPAGHEGNNQGCPVCLDCDGTGQCAPVPENSTDVGCPSGSCIAYCVGLGVCEAPGSTYAICPFDPSCNNCDAKICNACCGLTCML